MARTKASARTTPGPLQTGQAPLGAMGPPGAGLGVLMTNPPRTQHDSGNTSAVSTGTARLTQTAKKSGDTARGLGIAAPAISKPSTGKNKGARKQAAADDSWDWNLEGTWDIKCPEISQNYSDGDFYFSINGATPSPNTMSVSFDLGILEGAMRPLTAPAPRRGASPQTIEFEWRGRSTGEGEIELGDDQKCIMTFVDRAGRGYVHGVFYGPFVGSTEFKGRKESDDCSGEVHDFNFYTHQQHEYERVSRWR